jgi:hypothetical protein
MPDVATTSTPEIVTTSLPEVATTSMPDVATTSTPEIATTSTPKLPLPPLPPLPAPSSTLTLPVPTPTTITQPIKRFKTPGKVIQKFKENVYEVEYYDKQGNNVKINAVSNHPLFEIGEQCNIQVEIYPDRKSAYILKIQPQRTSQLPTLPPTLPLTSQQILESDEQLPTPPPTTTKKPLPTATKKRSSRKLLPDDPPKGGNKCLIKYTVENT